MKFRHFSIRDIIGTVTTIRKIEQIMSFSFLILCILIGIILTKLMREPILYIGDVHMVVIQIITYFSMELNFSRLIKMKKKLCIWISRILMNRLGKWFKIWILIYLITCLNWKKRDI